MKKIKTLILILFVANFTYAQPAEGAYFSNIELQLHPRKVIAPNGQIAYMWSDCYEQLNFMQRADLKIYYDSVLIFVNKKLEEAKINAIQNPKIPSEVGLWEAEKSFYMRKLQYIKAYDDWEMGQ